MHFVPIGTHKTDDRYRKRILDTDVPDKARIICQQPHSPCKIDILVSYDYPGSIWAGGLQYTLTEKPYRSQAVLFFAFLAFFVLGVGSVATGSSGAVVLRGISDLRFLLLVGFSETD